MKNLRLYVLVFLLFVVNLNAGKLTKEQVTVTYVYKLSKNIYWNSKNKIFHIHLVSSNKKLNNEFIQLSRNLKMYNKKIIITTGTTSVIPRRANVVFIERKYNSIYGKIFRKTLKSKKLLISNGYKDKKSVMINLYKTKNNTMSFEINKANIIYRKLQINPNIILLGGTEMDVAYLYRDSQKNLSKKDNELKSSYTKLKKLKKELDTDKNRLAKMKKDILVFKKANNKLREDIKKEKNILFHTKEEIKIYEHNANELKNKIKNQDTQLESMTLLYGKAKKSLQDVESSLVVKNEELDKQQQKLSIQQLEVSKKEEYLQTLRVKIDSKKEMFTDLQNKISEQSKVIIDGEETINLQRLYLTLSILAGIVFFILVLYITKLLFSQRKSNRILVDTKNELKIAKNKADQANFSKSRFIASMSHELRTPLNAVLGYSQLLQKDKTFSLKHQKTFATIRNSGEHLLNLVNDILLISKIESGHVALNLKAINIRTFMDGLYSLFVLKIESKNLTYSVEVDDDVPEYLVLDIDKVRQILINIISNAVKFTNDGVIEIKAIYLNDKLSISVKDTGCGIEEDEMHKLFQQYEQTSSGIDEGKGTGLGLAIVEQFLNIMDGDVTVDSVVGEGTIFYVELPVERANVSDIEKSEPIILGLKPNQKNINILVVDDIETNRELLKEILSIIGFNVDEVINGLEAVNYVEKRRPDLILMDLRMPVMNGREATNKILKLDNSIPIIAITASIIEMEMLISNPKPFVDAIPKPFRESELLALISKHIDLEYIYEEDTTQVETTKKLSLKNLDQDYLSRLLKSVESMNVTSTTKLVNELDAIHKEEKLYIEDLVSDLNFELLRNSLKEALI